VHERNYDENPLRPIVRIGRVGIKISTQKKGREERIGIKQ
jgi:hypothetical protein